MTKANIILTVIIAILVGLCVFLYMRPTQNIAQSYQQATFAKIDSINRRFDSIRWFVNIYIPPQNNTKVRVDSFYNFKPIYDKDSLLNSFNTISRIKIK